MNNPVFQHDLPKTYLKRFVGDPTNRKKKSFVWCFWCNKQETKLQEESIDSKKFKLPDFYTTENIEPYAIEHFFRTEIEPLYNKIVIEIENENENEDNFLESCRRDLLVWFFYNKYRNRDTRRIFTELVKEINANYSIDKEAKNIHTNYLFTQEIAEKFWSMMAAKEWTVFKSHSKFPFITNDNPGFSIVREEKGPKGETMSSNYSTEIDKTNYFIISPKYCLEVSPYRSGTPIGKNFYNQNIIFKEATLPMIKFINSCTVACRTKYLISNNRGTLEVYGNLAKKLDEVKIKYNAALTKLSSNLSF